MTTPNATKSSKTPASAPRPTPTQTITAIATPQGTGGVSIIRLSGSKALGIAKALTHKQKIMPRYAHFAHFYTDDGQILDSGLLLYFAAPHSFTGEDVVEIQGHGGTVLTNMLLKRVFALGAVQAAAGEFSARAFANEKIDLVQAESIADSIAATSEAAARSAVRALTGEFSQKVNTLLEQLTRLRLHVEAAIDFPDEEDVDFLGDGQIESALTQIEQHVARLLETSEQGQLLRDGAAVVIAGKPNAGKSSLLNRLAGNQRAIVTEVAGTTRDTLDERININGLTINLTDTAGLRDTQDAVEKIGIDRAHDAIEQADLLLLVHDLQEAKNPLVLAKELFGELPEPSKMLIIGNKRDLLTNPVYSEADEEVLDGFIEVNISCATGEGLDFLKDMICQQIGFHPAENTHIARTRHLDALRQVEQQLNDAREQLLVYKAGELMAESLRQAQLSLGQITGEFTADDLLGEIFGSFCIGK